MTERASCWSVTINNPIKNDEENVALARQRGWKVEGQLEKGESGTTHYQLVVSTPQVRFSAIKKQFPRAHIEIARNRAALEAYCTKEETRVSELPTSQDQYPSQQKIWMWFEEERSLKELKEEFSDTCGTTARFVEWVENTNQMLDQFDRMISKKISQGYYCELIGINPQVRSAVKRYGLAILEREYIRRQTDRQTEEIIVAVPVITNGEGETYGQEGKDTSEEYSRVEE